MPNWQKLDDEINALKARGSAYDMVRRKYLRELCEFTNRNVIIYYSGWLQKPQVITAGFGQLFTINDSDKNGFMATIHQLEREKGLDLILHTPGGEISATESLVDYLRSMFRTDIRAIIPQLAMSAGTMIACSCKEIIMGKHSSIGPIDPQIGGRPAHGIIEEFERAAKEIKEDEDNIPLWQPIIAQYSPTLIGECNKAIELTNEVVKEWLVTGMFKGKHDPSPEKRADKVIENLASHLLSKTHDRHISVQKARDIGLNVKPLEDDQTLQDLVLSIHHACIHTLSGTGACKIIENHLGVANIMGVTMQPAQSPPQPA